MRNYLTFTLNQQLFGIVIDAVREINRVGVVTKIPDAPACVVGVTQVRDQVLPIIDLRVKFHLSLDPLGREACVIALDSPQGVIGILVHAVQAVVGIEASRIDTPPSLTQRGRHLLGIARINDSMVVLIDVLTCIQAEELDRISQLPSMALNPSA
jgi:purine-binding chemotaxis protein CheW